LRLSAIGVFEGRARFPGDSVHAVDAAYLTAGLVVPTATFAGLWLWRLRSRPVQDLRQEPPATEAELIRSVIAVHDRLDELRRQISELGDDWEKRDRELAECITGLIDLTEKVVNADAWVTRAGDDLRAADTVPGARDIRRDPGDLRRGGA